MARKIVTGMFVVLLLLAVLAGSWFYLVARSLTEKIDGRANYKGGARTAAVQIAFGEHDFFASHAQLDHLLTDDIRRACIASPLSENINKNRGSNRNDQCVLASPNSYAIYERHCNLRFLERCNAITLNEIVLEYPAIRDAVMQVIDDPCRYFPAQDLMDAEVERISRLDTPVFGSINVRNQADDRRRTCSGEELHESNLIIAIHGDAGGQYTVIKQIH